MWPFWLQPRAHHPLALFPELRSLLTGRVPGAPPSPLVLPPSPLDLAAVVAAAVVAAAAAVLLLPSGGGTCARGPHAFRLTLILMAGRTC